MKVLLLDPEDDIQDSWALEHWDLIVDLGRAPRSLYEEWRRRLGCPIFTIFDLALEVDDLTIWRDLLGSGMGRVVDRFGIDWWDVFQTPRPPARWPAGRRSARVCPRLPAPGAPPPPARARPCLRGTRSSFSACGPAR